MKLWIFQHIQVPLAKAVFWVAFGLLSLIAGGHPMTYSDAHAAFIENAFATSSWNEVTSLSWGYEKYSCSSDQAYAAFEY